MKNISVKIFVTAYIALLLVPSVFMFTGRNQVNTENRKMAALPVIKDENGLNPQYFTELGDYISDHIGLRTLMIEGNTFIHTKLFQDSPEEAVVLGRDGWLYYSDTVSDYMNIATLSEKNADNAGKTIKMLQDYAESQGVNFVMTIAPDKATLYGQHMPYYYIPTDGKGNLELITEALAKYDVNYADLRQSFVDTASDEVLYQATDSHWNYKGALLGYKTIMKSLELDDTRFDDLGFTARADWDADLATMLYSASADRDIQLYPDYEFKYEYTSHEKAVDSLKLTTYCAEGNGSAVIYRDSFFNTLQVYFAESFENVTFSRAYPYNTSLFTENQTDTVVLEIVERNLANLVKKAPVMAAPVLDNDEIPGSGRELAVIDANGTISYPDYEIYSQESSGYMHYYGFIKEEFEGDIILVKNNKCYRAFPVYEQELLESDDLQDNGFSVYIAQ